MNFSCRLWEIFLFLIFLFVFHFISLEMISECEFVSSFVNCCALVITINKRIGEGNGLFLGERVGPLILIRLHKTKFFTVGLWSFFNLYILSLIFSECCLYSVCDLTEIRPSIGFLLGEEELTSKLNFEGSNIRKNDVLISLGVEIFVLGAFDWKIVLGYVVTNDIEFRNPFSDKLRYCS